MDYPSLMIYNRLSVRAQARNLLLSFSEMIDTMQTKRRRHVQPHLTKNGSGVGCNQTSTKKRCWR